MLYPNHREGLVDRDPLTTIVQVQELALTNMANRNLTGVIMLDQTAVYDLLDRTLRRSKMDWTTSYLQDRVQMVKVQTRVSMPREVGERGAPKGSIMAGLFHVISSNDCPHHNTEGHTVQIVHDGKKINVTIAKKTQSNKLLIYLSVDLNVLFHFTRLVILCNLSSRIFIYVTYHSVCELLQIKRP